MNLTDILLLVGLIVYMIIGYRDGIQKKIFGILGFWAGLIVGTKLMDTVGTRFMDWFTLDEDPAYVLAFFCLFVGVAIVFNFSYRWFGKIGTESLPTISRIGGALLGAVQGLVALSLILIMFNIFDIPSEEAQNESLFYNETLQIAPDIFDYSTSWLPDSKVFFDELKGKMKHINYAR
ncbi:MAG TPA: CvpA family protein [Bacteroidota bacterium]|nr:CvpA family protein [Bacteroidota bacterium]